MPQKQQKYDEIYKKPWKPFRFITDTGHVKARHNQTAEEIDITQKTAELILHWMYAKD